MSAFHMYSSIWNCLKSTLCIFCHISWIAYPYLIRLVLFYLILILHCGYISKNGLKSWKTWDFQPYCLTLNWNQIYYFYTVICSTFKELKTAISRNYNTILCFIFLYNDIFPKFLNAFKWLFKFHIKTKFPMLQKYERHVLVQN